MVEYKPHGMAPKPHGMPPYAPKNEDGTFKKYNECNWLFKFLDPRDCPYFSKKGKCGLWFAFVVAICVFVFFLYVIGAFIYELFSQLCLKPDVDDHVKSTGLYDWLMGKKRGGMEWHRSAQRLEEEHKMFREKLATLGWANVPLDTIPGFNCAASREKEERIAGGSIMTPRDEEEGGGGGAEENVK